MSLEDKWREISERRNDIEPKIRKIIRTVLTANYGEAIAKNKILDIYGEKRKSEYYIILNFIDSSKEEHPIGMNNQYLLSNEHTFGLPTAVKGRWINDRLDINYNRLSRIEDYKFGIIFKDDKSIELTVTEASKGINQTIIGKTF